MMAARIRRPVARVVFFLSIVALSAVHPTGASTATPSSIVEPNDNRRPAGRVDGGTVTVALRAASGRWQPEGPAGPALEIEAFGEVGRTLSVPAPLIRVAEGTEIALSIRNDLAATLTVHGLCTRGGPACAPVQVKPSETRQVRFQSGPAGTYHYWASTLGAPVPFRELAGALIVDPPAVVEPDRILVITEWANLTAAQIGQIFAADVATEAFVRIKPKVTFVINGRSWPATERFSYQLGDRVRWRVINLSSQHHPFHLHGFYFDVDSMGNGTRDVRRTAADRPRVVTQLLRSGETMDITWVPERAGNWLFHCHVMHHVSLERRLDAGSTAPDHSGGGHAGHGTTPDASLGMAGMVVGVTVRDGAASDSRAPGVAGVTPRKLTLVMRRAPGQNGDLPNAGFVLSEGSGPPSSGDASAPGPAIVLRRDEPVEITLVNQLAEAIAIHWHGIELDSYYDGVHGWSGAGRRVTPMIEPGAQFVVRFTPPRAGTFIYHTHLHDYRQLTSGLYGPLIVREGDAPYDPVTDHVIVLGRAGLTSEEPSVLTEAESVVINGARAPRFVWKAGARHRVRLINITPDDIFNVVLQTAEGPVTWTPIAKDGAPMPAAAAVAGPASMTIAVGETYEFEFQAPAGRRTAWLEVRTPGGKWQAQGHVVIR